MQRTSASSADELLKHGRLEEARVAYQEILDQDADNMPAHWALGRIHRRCGRDNAACRHLRTAAERCPEPAVLLELAATLRALDQYPEAAALYQRLLIRDGQQLAAHFGLGWIARARQDEPAAIEHFSTALSVLDTALLAEPGNRPLEAQRAAALRELGRLDESAAVYERILAAGPDHAASHEGLGWVARKKRDFDDALRHFSAAAELNSTDPMAHLNVARLLVVMDRIPEAKTLCSAVLGRAPHHARVRAALGGLARSWRDWTDALEHYRVALELDPGTLAYRLALGHVLHELAHWEDAEAAFRGVLEESPQHIEAMLGLAETLCGRGDADAARSLCEAAASLAPLDYRPKNAIRRLQVAAGLYDWKTEIEEAVTLAGSPDATPAAQLESARTLVQFGLTEAAAPLLARLEAHSTEARQLLLAVRQIARMGLAQPLVAGTAYPDPVANQLESLQGYLEKPVPGSNTLLLVFAGTNNRLWMTFTLLHRILCKTGVSIVYARDLRQDWYAGGVVGLGDDFRSAVDGFRQLADRYGARRILTLGNCVGCLGALHFGLSLGAEGVLGFGPKLRPTQTMELGHRSSLHAFRARKQAAYAPVRQRYGAARVRPKVTLFFGEHCAGDAEEARAMAEIPDVVATAIPGSSDPDSLKDLLVLGVLETVLQDFVTAAAVPARLHTRISTLAAAAARA